MTKRQLFLVGYDICDDARRSKALRLIKGHTLGGQKSLYECWLSTGEVNELMGALRSLIDTSEDRLVFIRLDPRAESMSVGSEIPTCSPDYFHIT